MRIDAISEWVAVGPIAEIRRKRRVVLDVGGTDVVVVAHEDAFYAFQNLCIHRQRELAKGVILNGKLVCPGHQWAFALETGYEAVKQRCQPTYPVRVVGDTVEVGAQPAEGAA